MRLVVPVVLVLALAGCTSGTASPAAHVSPSAVVSPAASPPTQALVVAVTRNDHPGVWLYRVGADRVARHLSTIAPPRGRFFSTYGLSLSAGQRPDVCVIWTGDEPEGDGDGEEATYCYPASQPVGHRIPVEGQVDELALDATGTRLFWSTSDAESGATAKGFVAAYSAGRVSAERSFALDCSNYLLAALWDGRDRLVLHCTSGDSDDPGFLALQGISPSLGPLTKIPEPSHVGAGYNTFVHPGGVSAGGVLALEGQQCDLSCPGGGTGLASRAVRLDVRTGRVLEVIATPARGRSLWNVTGGPHGFVYVTISNGPRVDMRAYVRWPGERHGTPITGLPSDVEEVVAQP